ncbi:MAG: Trm112 family protein [Alphaproteobacteria bacterium]|nr:Trm112 family protein [Alphaproteobacteria bacterium]
MPPRSKPDAAAQCGVDRRLLELLVCPVTRAPLVFDAEHCELVSRKAGLAYPIRDGLPIMLASEARDLDAGGE